MCVDAGVKAFAAFVRMLDMRVNAYTQNDILQEGEESIHHVVVDDELLIVDIGLRNKKQEEVSREIHQKCYGKPELRRIIDRLLEVVFHLFIEEKQHEE